MSDVKSILLTIDLSNTRITVRRTCMLILAVKGLWFDCCAFVAMATDSLSVVVFCFQ